VTRFEEIGLRPLTSSLTVTAMGWESSVPPRGNPRLTRLETGTQLIIDTSCVPVSAPESLFAAFIFVKQLLFQVENLFSDSMVNLPPEFDQ